MIIALFMQMLLSSSSHIIPSTFYAIDWTLCTSIWSGLFEDIQSTLLQSWYLWCSLWTIAEPLQICSPLRPNLNQPEV